MQWHFKNLKSTVAPLKATESKFQATKNLRYTITNPTLYRPALHGNVLPLTFYPWSRALARDHDLVRSRDASDPAAVRG